MFFDFLTETNRHRSPGIQHRNLYKHRRFAVRERLTPCETATRHEKLQLNVSKCSKNNSSSISRIGWVHFITVLSSFKLSSQFWIWIWIHAVFASLGFGFGYQQGSQILDYLDLDLDFKVPKHPKFGFGFGFQSTKLDFKHFSATPGRFWVIFLNRFGLSAAF